MRREIEYQWRVREMMARQRIKSSTELVQPLRDRGITLSASQVYRLVGQEPERIAFKVLVALCDILHCELGELLTYTATDARTTRRTGTADTPDIPDLRHYRPIRARITDTDDDG